MGRNSQQRRAQQKRRNDVHADVQLQEALLAAAGWCSSPDGKAQFARAVRHLTEIEVLPAAARRVSTTLAGMLHRLVGSLFEGGWQPADIAHLVKRERTVRAHRLIVAVIAGQSRVTDAATRAPDHWLGQLEDLGVYDPTRSVLVGGYTDAFASWVSAERLDADEMLTIALQVMATLLQAPRLARLVEPPSKWSASNRGVVPPPDRARGAAARDDVDAKALKLIRALLAKAEATTFDAEAEAFTAKAQELMTRHSIDAAVLASAARDSGHDVGVESRRVHIDSPYADEKATLLSVIADVNGARCVWSAYAGFSTVVGFPVDLHLTDLLFTSLLVQATRASAEATASDRDLRTPSFRRAFLLSYAYRIGERLRATKKHAESEAEQQYGSALVPILADREAAVNSAFEQAFPDTHAMTSRRLNAEGYHAGRAAADRAHIGAGEPIDRT